MGLHSMGKLLHGEVYNFLCSVLWPNKLPKKCVTFHVDFAPTISGHGERISQTWTFINFLHSRKTIFLLFSILFLGPFAVSDFRYTQVAFNLISLQMWRACCCEMTFASCVQTILCRDIFHVANWSLVTKLSLKQLLIWIGMIYQAKIDAIASN